MMYHIINLKHIMDHTTEQQQNLCLYLNDGYTEEVAV